MLLRSTAYGLLGLTTVPVVLPPIGSGEVSVHDALDAAMRWGEVPDYWTVYMDHTEMVWSWLVPTSITPAPRMGHKLRFYDGLFECVWAGPLDINIDGFIDGIDYDAFNNWFMDGHINADYNLDGFVDGIDKDRFDNDWEDHKP